MKKIFSIMLGLAMAMGVNAQTENPNRLIMMSQAGNKAYAFRPDKTAKYIPSPVIGSTNPAASPTSSKFLS